ncbi:hypothetical protein BRADI_5g03483v3 [Brachypodium distachyon]|uniref:Uncharacterized protein n=1 Tax=Brachypodium distachyon TaxID=15368 RepID=A0A0Q3I735_BRADI|nr:hypothetical protein BRADI_5g03483v3 [Brachypodium distachyon]
MRKEFLYRRQGAAPVARPSRGLLRAQRERGRGRNFANIMRAPFGVSGLLCWAHGPVLPSLSCLLSGDGGAAAVDLCPLLPPLAVLLAEQRRWGAGPVDLSFPPLPAPATPGWKAVMDSS